MERGRSISGSEEENGIVIFYKGKAWRWGGEGIGSPLMKEAVVTESGNRESLSRSRKVLSQSSLSSPFPCSSKRQVGKRRMEGW